MDGMGTNTTEEVNNSDKDQSPKSANSEDEFYGYDLEADNGGKPHEFPPTRQRRVTKKPSRYADFVP